MRTFRFTTARRLCALLLEESNCLTVTGSMRLPSRRANYENSSVFSTCLADSSRSARRGGRTAKRALSSINGEKRPDIVPAGRKMSVAGGAEMARTDRSNRNKLQAKTAIHFLLPGLLSRCLARTNAPPRTVGLSAELDYPRKLAKHERRFFSWRMNRRSRRSNWIYFARHNKI